MEPRPGNLDAIDEARLRLVANTVPVLLAYIDDGARYVWCNEAYRRWFGRPPESLRGQHMREVLGDGAWAAVQPQVERVLAGERVEYETRLHYMVGPRDVRAVYVPDRDTSGRVRGFVVLVTDVGEMRSAERALQDSQRMLAQSQAAAHVGSWEATQGEDGATKSLRWSDENYRIFGHEPGAVPVDRDLFVASIHPEDRALMLASATAEIAKSQRFEQEFRIVRPDGSVRLIHSWTTVERNAAGRPFRLLGTCQDITERKLAQSEIRQTREKLQLIMDATPAIIARYDWRGQIVWANRSYAARFGQEPEQLEGRHLREVIGEEAFAAIAPTMARVLGGETIEIEADFPYPVVGTRTMHVRAAPTFDAKGNPDGCVAVLTDNTHRRALERERERALQELKDADRRKDEFLAMLSHELRNPMAPILTAVEVLRLADPNDTETSVTSRAVIERQVLHMKRLLDDLLDVSRVSQGKIELRREVLELAPVLQRAAEVSRPLMAEKDQRLSVTSVSTTVRVDADATRLVQVFGNLLNNAAKYSEPGGSIEVDLAVEGAEAVVRVRDHGMGMNLDLLEKAFDLFVQDTRSLDRSQGGMGIGLTMVRSLVKMHGGSVRAFSDGPGRGCEVVVRLPRAPSDAPEAGRTPAGVGIVRAARPLRILVVDDNVDAARTLGQLLGLLGHTVALAHDGPSALAASQEMPPELVFIDIGLPGMDGYGLAAALRAGGLDRAALVAVTGYGRDEDVRRSGAHGFDHHLVKPVDMAALQRVTAQHQSS